MLVRVDKQVDKAKYRPVRQGTQFKSCKRLDIGLNVHLLMGQN